MLDTEKYSKSIDFLLDKAGPVIQYRLRKELLHSITESEEKALLEKIYCLPLMELLKTYVKPCGYIGSGMHSWDTVCSISFHPHYKVRHSVQVKCFFSVYNNFFRYAISQCKDI